MNSRWVLVGVFLVGAIVLAAAIMRAYEARMSALEGQLLQVAEARSKDSSSAPAAPTPLLGRPVYAPAPTPVAAPQQSSVEAMAEAPAPPPAPSQEDQVAYVEAVYSQQPRDPSWARDSLARLTDGIAEQLGTSTLESLECRESLCKAELRHSDAADFSGFIDRLIGNANALWTGPLQSFREPIGPDGVVRNAIYFAKDGTELPRLE